MQEVDATDIIFLLEQLVVISLVNQVGKQKYIDDVM